MTICLTRLKVGFLGLFATLIMDAAHVSLSGVDFTKPDDIGIFYVMYLLAPVIPQKKEGDQLVKNRREQSSLQ